MKLRLSDVLDNLLVGEFAQMGWAADGEFSITTTNKIITLLNTALGDISARFWVKRKEVMLQMCKGQTLYVIDKSVNNKKSSLLRGQACLTTTTGEVFEDDLIEIYEIYDASGKPLIVGVDAGESYEVGRTCGCGCGAPVNDPHKYKGISEACLHKRYMSTLDRPGAVTTRWAPYGCATGLQPLADRTVQLAAYNIIRVPDSLPVQRLRIVYRAGIKRVKKVEDDGLYDPSQIVLDVPYTFLNAILNFIAYRKTSANNKGVVQVESESNGYYTKYLSACQLIQDQGLGVEPVINPDNRFIYKGFV